LAFFFRSESTLLRGWLKRLPEDLLRSRPLLCAVYAHTIAHSGIQRPSVLRTAEYWFAQADRAFQNTAAAPADGEYLELTRNFIALSNAYLAGWRHRDPRTVIDIARQALAALPRADGLPADSNYLRFRSGLNFNLGMHYIAIGDYAAADGAFLESRKIGELSGDWLNAYASAGGQCYILRLRGKLGEAEAVCREALESLGRSGGELPVPPIPYSGILHIDLGLIWMEWNELGPAEESIRTGLELMRMAANTDKQAEATAALAGILQARRDPSAASFLAEAEKTMPELNRCAAVHKVRSWLRQGALDSAVRWAQGRTLEDEPGVDSLALARVILACNPPVPPRRRTPGLPDLVSLRQYLERQILSAERAGWIDRLIEWQLLLALAWQADRDSLKAVSAVRQALSLAQAGRYIRRFAAEGKPVLLLLKSMEGKSGSLDPYIARLLAAGALEEGRPPAPALQPLIEPLSGREMEVLHLMALGDSNAEIAKKLVITLNTTKKHITHIFEKLDVANRSKAVIRARDLGLVT
jgi:LuxR family maltose regulon positive regulatory protein